MKHLHTFQNEYLMYLKSLPAHCASCDELNENEKEANSMPCKQAQKENGLPGRHIVSNIMNYARALEVFRRSDGESLLLIIN